MDKEQADLDAMSERCNQGILDLYKDLAKLTGEEPPTKLEDCIMSVSDFEKEMKRLGE